MRLSNYKAEIFVAGSVLLAATGQILIKLGLTADSGLTNVLFRWPLSITVGVVLGLLVYGMGTILWFFAVASKNISYVYPLAATNYVLLGVAGHVVLHEAMDATRWIGIAVMAVGIALLSQGKKEMVQQ